jgi:hypothetical protein
MKNTPHDPPITRRVPSTISLTVSSKPVRWSRPQSAQAQA